MRSSARFRERWHTHECSEHYNPHGYHTHVYEFGYKKVPNLDEFVDDKGEGVTAIMYEVFCHELGAVPSTFNLSET